MTAFNGASRDPDAVMAGLDQWAQGFAEKAQRYQAAQQRTEQLRLTASSANGVVRVTVGADGNVTALELGDRIRTMPPEDVAAQILDTMRRAQAGIADRVSEVMVEQLSPADLQSDTQTRSELLGTLRSKFPRMDDDEDDDEDEDEVEPPPPPPPTPASDGVRGSDDDEDSAPW